MQSRVKEKARRGPGGDLVGLAANQSDTLSIADNPGQRNTHDQSAQLDFALERAEFHEEQKVFHLAQAHHGQAEKHRLILKSLQALIPPPAKFNTGGDSTDG